MALGTLLTVAVFVGVLYVARDILIPLALAAFFAFMLAPLVVRLRRWGLGRMPSVVLVVLLAFGLLAIIGSVMTTQLTDLGHKLPGYQQNVHQKFQALRASGTGLLSRASHIMHNLVDGDGTSAREPGPKAETPHPPPQNPPSQGPLSGTSFSPVSLVQKILGSVFSAVLTAAIVVVLVVFMLLQQEDLRDRVIRLAGAGRVSLTTRVLDDASSRISRYLLAQVVLNSAYGVLAGMGLYFLGVPNPLLWGMMAALFRYVPYVGIWVAATMAAAVAFAVEPGWGKMPVIFGMFFGLDLLLYNFAEPFLYGSSTGVSPLAILVAAVFWAWLWGGVGLLLATPLTVCVVVLGRHISRLEFLSTLLSDEPALSSETRFYQRMLALDPREAMDYAETYLCDHSLAEFYDNVAVPALSQAGEEWRHRRLDASQRQLFFQNVRDLVQRLGAKAEALAEPAASPEPNQNPPAPRVFVAYPMVLCLPARDEADVLAALMLEQLLRQRGIAAKALPQGAGGRETWKEPWLDQAKVACVLGVPPAVEPQVLQLCHTFHDRFEEIRVVAGVLAEHDITQIHKPPEIMPAELLASSLGETLETAGSMLSAPPAPAQPHRRAA